MIQIGPVISNHGLFILLQVLLTCDKQKCYNIQSVNFKITTKNTLCWHDAFYGSKGLGLTDFNTTCTIHTITMDSRRQKLLVDIKHCHTYFTYKVIIIHQLLSH